ncbi:TIGR03857 family LLM class F420-dependent oxidoreductase [Nocardia sp. NBC_00565]|uniref:TIGR03857 family LLM class F420-dependent oxidoreductase n=1 Tax=Nocardia sp. NBC_00565 TaxID=2975993 RepID=UPI002E80E466|nr:TIGR03857 family LLM class F420-dependent oxidoreductase [Nocardia sp. NBC_00565]WUC06833.1 TIGR03857 family LLM class F420-dependent oxidoreductase [Nocardia sp. NBC_00565]
MNHQGSTREAALSDQSTAASAPTDLALGGYALPGRVPDPRPAIAQAIAAQRLGMSTVWLSERWGTKDFGVLAGAFSQVTSTIKIGAGITHFQSRHPALLASLAMTAQGLSDGRVVLGIGRSVDKMWSAVGLPKSTNASIVDSVDIFRRLCRGERVKYDGPAGTYPSLRLTDVPEAPVPPLVFAAIGSKGLELAGRHFDGVLLHPFLTPEAVRRSADVVRAAATAVGRDPKSVRIYATVIVASGLSAEEEAAVVGGRAVSYYQIPTFGEQLATANGWDVQRLADIRDHPLLAGVRGAADSVLERDQLVEVARVLPEQWVRGAAALGTPSECWAMFERYRDSGADELVLHGSTPDQLEDVVGARPGATLAVK